MPTYEYTCRSCKKRFGLFLTYQEYDHEVVKCGHCGSADVERKIGRVRIAKAGRSDMPNMPDGEAPDPGSMARMMRQMSQETGEPMPEEMNEMVHRMERGESISEIEKNMPDLGSDGSSGPDLM